MTRVRGLLFLSLFFLSGALLPAQSSGLTLTELVKKAAVQVWLDPWRAVVLLRSSAHDLTLDLATGLALGDGATELLLSPTVDLGAEPVFSAVDAAKVLEFFGRGRKTPATKASPETDPPVREGTSRRIQAIVLDAGHGGSDPGSLGSHVLSGQNVLLREKDLTLAVVLEAESLLSQAFPDRTIVLTRRTDTYPTLEERVATAHAQKLGPRDSILFLSIHFNASLNKNASGLEFWYVPEDYERDVIASKGLAESAFPVLNALVDEEFKKESRALAKSLAQSYAQELGDEQISRGLKENPWFVVRMARMPAVLAELGFITSPVDAALLNDAAYLKKLARGLYNGVAAFIRAYEELP